MKLGTINVPEKNDDLFGVFYNFGWNSSASLIGHIYINDSMNRTLRD
jgi:hypothetical protein